MLRMNVGDYLKRHHITPYRLVKESGLAQATVYALARKPAQRVDLDTVSSVLSALRRITGQPVTVNDLLEELGQPLSEEGRSQRARARAEALLIRPQRPGKPQGSKVLAEVGGPPIEDVLGEHRGPEQ